MLYAIRKQCSVFTTALIVVLLATTAFMSVPATAKEKQSMKNGVAACKRWCDGSNSTTDSQRVCYVKCEKYWLCNGRDSTASTCADGRNLEVDRGDTPTPPTKPKKPEMGTPGTTIEQ